MNLRKPHSCLNNLPATLNQSPCTSSCVTMSRRTASLLPEPQPNPRGAPPRSDPCFAPPDLPASPLSSGPPQLTPAAPPPRGSAMAAGSAVSADFWHPPSVARIKYSATGRRPRLTAVLMHIPLIAWLRPVRGGGEGGRVLFVQCHELNRCRCPTAGPTRLCRTH